MASNHRSTGSIPVPRSTSTLEAIVTALSQSLEGVKHARFESVMMRNGAHEHVLTENGRMVQFRGEAKDCHICAGFV